MKILLTATVQSHICQFHRPLVEILHQNACEVHVAACNNLKEKNGLKLDFVDKVFEIPFSRSPKSKKNLKAYRALKNIINSENYDIIHCNTPMGGIITRLASCKARKNGTEVYYTAHGFHFYQGAPKKNWILYYPLERFFSKMTDKLITITKEDYQLAKEKFHCEVEYIHGVGVDETRYHNVSETEKLKLKKTFGIPLDQKIILCVGELLPNKNQQMVIRTMKKVLDRYPNTCLFLAGNGQEKNNLEELIVESGLQKHVKLLGYVTNLQEYQQIADIAVSCSKREGLPLNIVEAMLSGTPVVATNNRGHRELICNGENGYLVDINDFEKMAEDILMLLNNIDLYKKIKSNARLNARAYTTEKVKKELMGVYKLKNE